MITTDRGLSRPALRDILYTLDAEELIQADGDYMERAEEAVTRGDSAPWYVHLFIGVGTWFGALMLALFLAVAGFLNFAGSAGILGVFLFIAAAKLARQDDDSVFITQVIWVSAICAQIALLVAFGENLGLEGSLLLAAGLQGIAFLIISHSNFRLLMTIGMLSCLTYFTQSNQGFSIDLLAVLCAGACLFVWFQDARLCTKKAEFWRPIAYGLPIGLAFPLTSLTWLSQSGLYQQTLFIHSSVTALMLAALCLVAMFLATQELDIRPSPTAKTVAVALVVLIAFLTGDVPGVMGAFLLLILAHWRGDRMLEAIALIQMTLFGTFFYYDLDTTLLRKSLWVILTGLVFLTTAWGLRRRLQARENPDHLQTSDRQRLSALAAAVLLALAIPGASVLHKESILNSGRTVLLELRPVDPRSLMQGDYMVLRYALENEVDTASMETSGELILQLDDHGVATFAGIDRALQEGEQRLDYRLRKRDFARSTFSRELRLGAESFFFEEGTAALYEQAKYGELRVAPSGAAVLVGLRDEQKQPLGQSLH